MDFFKRWGSPFRCILWAFCDSPSCGQRGCSLSSAKAQK